MKGLVNYFESEVMESKLANWLAANFDNRIISYRFDSLADTSVGGLLLGVTNADGKILKINANAVNAEGMLRIDPVQTSAGVLYVSYYDHDRTDGRNDFEHVSNEQPGNPNDRGGIDIHSVPVASTIDPFRFFALAAPPELAVTDIDSQLRIYRFAATTTGEFYQATELMNFRSYFRYCSAYRQLMLYLSAMLASGWYLQMQPATCCSMIRITTRL
ncbi:MAG: hypothetical protein ACU843_12595 [Gammaproteobacteria bacterium]